MVTIKHEMKEAPGATKYWFVNTVDPRFPMVCTKLVYGDTEAERTMAYRNSYLFALRIWALRGIAKIYVAVRTCYFNSRSYLRVPAHTLTDFFGRIRLDLRNEIITEQNRIICESGEKWKKRQTQEPV